LQALHICREIREEAKKFFFQNKFYLQFTYPRNLAQNLPQSFAENIQNVTYHWDGRNKEISWIARLAKFDSLKDLHITFGTMLAGRHLTPPAKPNKLYQDDKTIKRFSIAPGFDKLVLIRGLNCVTFSSVDYNHHPQTRADMKAFEKFLNRILTQPKEASTVVSPISALQTDLGIYRADYNIESYKESCSLAESQ
jgi:hypothetical protein